MQCSVKYAVCIVKLGVFSSFMCSKVFTFNTIPPGVRGGGVYIRLHPFNFLLGICWQLNFVMVYADKAISSQ